MAATGAWTETTRPTQTLPPSANNAPIVSSANTTPSPLHLWPTATTPSWTPFAFQSSTPWTAGHGSTTPRPLSTKVPRKTLTPPCSRPSFSSTGSDHSRFSPWAQRRPPTSRTTDPFTTNPPSSTYLPLNLDGTSSAASPPSAATPAGAPTTPTTCPSTYQQTLQRTCSTPSRANPLRSTSRSTTSHPHLNASKANRPRATNSFPAVAGLSRSFTKPTRSDCRALPGSGNSASNTPDATYSSAGLAPLHNTTRQTASTDRDASVPRSVSCRVLKAIFPSPPATPSFPATPGYAPSAPPYFRQEHTYRTNLAMTYGGWARLTIALRRALFQTTPTSYGSWTTLDRSRSTSGRRFTQPPWSLSTDSGVYNALVLGA